MQATLTFVISLLLSLQQLAGSTAHLPHLTFDLLDHTRGQVCYRTASKVQTELHNFQAAEHGYLSEENMKDYPKKPSTVSADSPCFGMLATCCLPRKEEDLKNAVRMEFQNKLQNAFEKRAEQKCRKAGRDFERVLYGNIKGSIKLLREELSGIMVTNITQELFQDFSDYLYKFVFSRDFCPLRDIAEQQLSKVFRVAYQTGEIEDQSLLLLGTNNKDSCFDSLETYFVTTWLNDTVQSLVQTLNSIRLIAETFELVQSIVTDVRRHKWGPECVSGLFTIRHCAYCIGYENFHHCDGNCLNVLRGCTADMAELQKDVKDIQNLLLSLTKLAQSELSPIKLLKTTFVNYILLGKHLNQFNFTNAIISGTNCSVEESDEKSLRHLDTTLQYINVTNIETTSTNSILAAVRNDLDCFKDLQSLLLELPEEICGVNPHHLAYMRDRECWNGTDRGSYSHSIVGHYKMDQLNNPAFINRPLPTNSSFTKTQHNIKLVTKDIYQTIDFYQCLNGDDEDCSTRFVIQCEQTIPTEDVIGSGSGSGSGSGMGGAGDLEKHHTSTSNPYVIVLGGKRKINDYEDDDDTIVAHTITSTAPRHTKTSSALPLSSSTQIPTTSKKSSTQISTTSSPTKTSLKASSASIIINNTPDITPDGYRGSGHGIRSGLLITISSILFVFIFKLFLY